MYINYRLLLLRSLLRIMFSGHRLCIILIIYRSKPYIKFGTDPSLGTNTNNNNNLADKDVVDYGSRNGDNIIPPPTYRHPDLTWKKNMFDEKVTYTKFT